MWLLGSIKNKSENHVGGDSVDWFVSGVDYYFKLFWNIFTMNFILKEETLIPITANCSYCGEEWGNDCVEDHDQSIDVFRGYAQNKRNLLAKSTFLPL